MKVRTSFPQDIEEIENLWIPLSDGTRLSARIWLPRRAHQQPVPALLEYLPYRKDDGTAIRDARRQPYLAGHGYAAVRVDMRGSGSSDGLLLDEYLRQEQDDALEVLTWIADQDWCDGNLGMHGISWGGFNSLQVAARRPPELKAVLVIGFTDDRYADDVHYMGGCVLASQMLQWSSVMFTYNASPPDPRWVGERWREMWLHRMEHTPPFVEAWLHHQRRDAYWKHGSVREDYAAIQVPVYAVGGWADAYNNSIPRLLAGLSVPRKGLIGPWAHTFPESGPPGPAIGFLQESVRWWDHWLKGIDTGIMDEPGLVCWIQESEPPARHYTVRKGYWVADPGWPAPSISTRRLFLNSANGVRSVEEAASEEQVLAWRGELVQGFEHCVWGAYGAPGSYPGDLRGADGQALTFDSAPLPDPVVLLGNPIVTLELAVDQPLALLAIRLCDVSPEGSSALVSWGLLNLTHYRSHASPEPLEPGRRYRVTVALNMTGYAFAAGHQLRVAISTAYPRQAWPSPRPVGLSIFAGAGCHLDLPVRAAQATDGEVVFPEPASARSLPVEQLRPAARRQQWLRDHASGKATFTLEQDAGLVRYPSRMEVDDWSLETQTLTEGDPLSMAQRVQSRLSYRRDDWGVRIETDSRLTAVEGSFYLSHQLDAFEGETRVFTKSWTRAIPRDLV